MILIYILSRAAFQLSCSKLLPLTKGCLSLMNSFSVISLNMAISHILPKIRLLGLYFVANNIGLPSTNLTQLALKANAFRLITQSNGHYNVQGQSRSAILVAWWRCCRASDMQSRGRGFDSRPSIAAQ